MSIYIFGASQKGKYAYELLRDQYEIDGFIDNDKSKWGDKLFNKTIFSIEDIKDINTQIIICSTYFKEIETQLQKLSYLNVKTLEELIIDNIILNPQKGDKYFERSYGYLNYEILSVHLMKRVNINSIQTDDLRNIIHHLKPIGVNIEFVRGCNLKCPLCQLQENNFEDNYGDKNGIMNMNTFERIVELLPKSIATFGLYNYGEPLLDKNLFEKIKILKDKREDILVGMDTNLSLDFDPFKMVNSGIDYIQVAFDGYSQETYSKYRKNGNFEKVISNISRIKAVKRMLNINTPEIIAKTILFKYLVINKDFIYNLALGSGADKHDFVSAEFNSNCNEKIDDWIPEEQKYTHYDIIKSKETNNKKYIGEVEKNNCCMRMIAPILVIDYLGNVYPCCALVRKDFNMGNININSFEEIWNSKKFVDFRLNAFFNKNKYENCKQCLGSILENDRL